jgi:hypothetical protein
MIKTYEYTNNITSVLNFNEDIVTSKENDSIKFSKNNKFNAIFWNKTKEFELEYYDYPINRPIEFIDFEADEIHVNIPFNLLFLSSNIPIGFSLKFSEYTNKCKIFILSK